MMSVYRFGIFLGVTLSKPASSGVLLPQSAVAKESTGKRKRGVVSVKSATYPRGVPCKAAKRSLTVRSRYVTTVCTPSLTMSEASTEADSPPRVTYAPT